MQNRWTVIRNPSAASGKGDRVWPAIEKALTAAGWELDVHVTAHAGHATALARQALAAGHRQLLAIGGDGTAHEVANGILSQAHIPSQEILLAQIPVGTGNDWGRTMGIPAKMEDAVAVLRTGTHRVQDVGRATLRDSGEQRFFINVAGMGYDGMVARVANERKAQDKGGMLGYVGALLSCLMKYKAQPLEVTQADGTQVSAPMFSLAAGICKHNGGGMKPCPEAIPDDGLLDLTWIGNLSKLAVLRNVPRLFSGTFVKHPAVSQYRSASFALD